MDAGLAGLVVVVGAVAAFIGLVELGLFDGGPDVRPLAPSGSWRRGGESDGDSKGD